MKAKQPKKVLILGSGGLRIGQAGEFDYSGSQAIKALKERGIKSVLINPNIATVQTDESMADKVYFEPLQPKSVIEIIKKEKPDAVMLGFGGQTALNLGLKLNDQGVFKKFGLRVLGTPVSSIKTTEDRGLFKKALAQINVKTARSATASTVKQALAAGQKIGYPLMVRSGYSLGGLGSGIIKDEDELRQKASQAFKAVPQLLIEEYLTGWKEVEYEVVRDQDSNSITVCNMENFDPMGVHTGESIVVAPSQTLSNYEYHMLREVALKTINHLGIIGECNIQYALHPESGDYRVIEVNARLSRSSALASKATGYPLAFVAAKLSLGEKLYQLDNVVTKKTSAFFEPALDYIAVKIPRWDMQKLKSSDRRIGTEMKSVGEVMALGRSFPEAIQKAVRMLNIGADGLCAHPFEISRPLEEIAQPTDRRLFALGMALQKKKSVDKLHQLSRIDPWFLYQLKKITDYRTAIQSKPLIKDVILEAKKLGFSDQEIASANGRTTKAVRQKRLRLGIKPVIKQIDTLAGEFDAQTNYLYVTYHGHENDIKPLSQKSALLIGSGPYCIGSSVEFDWCSVNAARTFSKNNYQTIIINSNPETVSTDFDHSDRLYFDELTEERVLDIAEFEKPNGVVVSTGGQIANNLALSLSKNKLPIFGTPAKMIDKAEDRHKFSSMLERLDIDQPRWTQVTNLNSAKQFAKKVGYPILIRPSYVLSGGAMNVVRNDSELSGYLKAATKLSPDHPVVISQFIQGAKELEIDGVAQNGNLVIYAMSEHVENAGVHSGDATVVYPAQKLYIETIRQAKNITKKIIKNLDITGPFNIQFIAKDNALKVIECNVRASRSLPFVSKVSGYNFIDIAARAMLGQDVRGQYQTLELDHVGVKSPQFSYNRLKGADPVASVEMASTGEVACIGDHLESAFYRSWQATEQSIDGKNIFLSLPDEHKAKFLEPVRNLSQAGWQFYCTRGTHNFFKRRNISTELVHKIKNKVEPGVDTLISNQGCQLAINVPSEQKDNQDAYKIRRLAIDHHLPLVTNAEIGLLLLKSQL